MYRLNSNINSYDDFIKSVNWDKIKQHIKDIMRSEDNKKRYELLKNINRFRQFSNIELDISNIAV